MKSVEQLYLVCELQKARQESNFRKLVLPKKSSVNNLKSKAYKTLFTKKKCKDHH